MLLPYYTDDLTEAGCDEAGRGCLAGPVYAAAVVLPKNFRNELLTDSKQLTRKQRESLRPIIENEALTWAVASVSNAEIDEINILNASFRAMGRAIKNLAFTPQLLLIDGNRFKNESGIPHHCIVKGDSIYLSIAAASVLAKTYRDDFMESLHTKFPVYDWAKNKGYPTLKHRQAINIHGFTPYHRLSFHFKGQLKLEF